MADEKPHGGPTEIALALIGFLGVVTLGWFMFGGWKNADLSGYFLSAPTAPQINPGGAIIEGATVSPATHSDATTTPQL